MKLRNRLKEPRVMIRIGAACLLLANLSHWFFHPSTGRGLVDGATGMLFGLSIGLMLVAARLNSRQHRGGDGGSPCSSS